jgi:flagellar basal-body rod protein FlgG
LPWSRPSSCPNDAQTFTVGQDGTVSITTAGNPAAQVIGNLQTADFINPAGLQAIGNNLFLETAASGAPQVGTPGLNGFGTTLQQTLETPTSAPWKRWST